MKTDNKTPKNVDSIGKDFQSFRQLCTYDIYRIIFQNKVNYSVLIVQSHDVTFTYEYIYENRSYCPNRMSIECASQ